MIIKPTQRLYLIECNDHGEVFYKLGVTGSSINRRFCSGTGRTRAMPYKYTILLDLIVNFDLALKIENIIFDEFSSYHPAIKFCGYLECFEVSEALIQKILEMVKNG